jgi:2-polyprenyl-3-methyl-5-hydroxy-6-metoxy-1,4-benzoquinol methylase
MQWTPERIARFWDWQSQYPEQYFTFQFGRQIAGSLSPFLKGRKRILDYGCGVGHLLPHLCNDATEAYGADPSAESVARTNGRLSGTPGFRGAYLIGDLKRLEVKFDAILAMEVIEHLGDAELKSVLLDFEALLAPGGVIILTTPNNEDLSKSMVICPATGEVFHRWQHVRSWSAESLARRLREENFEVLQTVETNMATVAGNDPVRVLKILAKRVLFGDPGKPHLVCVATTRRPARG